VTHGFQYLDLDGGWYSADVGQNTVGGFGYGVTRSGQRIGGFGLAFFSTDPAVQFEGGVGGSISGQELRLGPVTLAAVMWTGVGGLKTNVPGMAGEWFTLFFEGDVEVGLAVTPWMQLTGYGGVQLLANLAPGRPFEGMLFYTPVVGVRLAWGSF
jgi:hypothetical protein